MGTDSFIPPESAGTTLWAFIGSPWGILAAWLIVINLITCFVFGFDKWKARWKEHHKSAHRVPEKTLFFLSAIGGSVGALIGMKVFHHKTLHKTFRFGIPAILILQIVVAAGMWVYFHAAW